MEETGQLHAPVILPPEGIATVLSRWAIMPVWKFRRRENSPDILRE
jgi:hypothetical protein